MKERKDSTQNSSDDSKQLTKEYEKVIELCKAPLKKDDTWCLLESNWYERWKKYVTEYEQHPGPIDNTDLFADETYKELKEHLIENMLFQKIPEEGWKLLFDHYGVHENQPVIARKVIEEGAYMKTSHLEIHPMQLKLCSYEDKEKIFVEKCSRVITIEQLDDKMRSLFDVSTNCETRIWSTSGSSYQKMEKNESIQTYCLQKDQLVVMEVKKPDEEWVLKDEMKSHTSFNGAFSNSKMSFEQRGYSSSSSYSSHHDSTPSTSTHQPPRDTITYTKKPTTPGLCGLSNLGNTCFMNSALQCLSNVPALSDYFKSEKYRNDLNDNNPLGTGGKLARSYAHLMRTMWSSENSSVSPREFKDIVGQFQPRFLGYEQHDSQELLAFLIDGLHEDLNRISDKPYVETKDHSGRPNCVVAAEAWKNHTKRNDSVIVDILHGLYRSTVDCSECPRVSVTFDPFCFLTLPLPVKKDKTLHCVFVPLDDTEEVVKYKLSVAKSESIEDLCKAISDHNQKPYANMTVTNTHNHKFRKIYKSSDNVSYLNGMDDIFVFEGWPSTTMFPVLMRYTSHSGSTHLFGQPLLVPVALGKVPYRHLYLAILNAAVHFLTNNTLKKNVAGLLGRDEKEPLELEAYGVSEMETQGDGECTDWLFDLFQIQVVNEFGSQDHRRLEDTDQEIELTDGLYLSADWSTNSYESYLTNGWTESFDVHENNLSGSAMNGSTGVDLINCMELFTSKERLEKDNTWFCSDCKEHQQAFKKFDLWVLPPVLIVHLKRFSNSGDHRDKVDTFVDFPIRDLDLSKFIVNPSKGKLPESQKRFNLIAVSNHLGGLGGGHYTAYAKNIIEKKWYHFDDTSVSLCSEDRVVTKAAYMLVYQRQDVDQWYEEHKDKPFPFLQPGSSPRAAESDREIKENDRPILRKKKRLDQATLVQLLERAFEQHFNNKRKPFSVNLGNQACDNGSKPLHSTSMRNCQNSVSEEAFSVRGNKQQTNQ